MPTRERMIQSGIARKDELGASTPYTVLYNSNIRFPRCMEHALHLGAGHFIQVVSPTSGRRLVKKIKKALRDAEVDDDNIDFDALGANLRCDDNDDDDDDDGDDDDDDSAASEAADFSVGDTIGKSLALVKQASTFHICKRLCTDIGL
jgi:hypothetical protein